MAVDEPICSIKIHRFVIEFDCEVPHGGMMSIDGVGSSCVHIFVDPCLLNCYSIKNT